MDRIGQIAMRVAGKHEAAFGSGLLSVKNDVEFILGIFSGTLQIGMGGEWWVGKYQVGKNIFHHRKEGIDLAYRAVEVDVRVVGSKVIFEVSGGFGNEATFYMELV